MTGPAQDAAVLVELSRELLDVVGRVEVLQHRIAQLEAQLQALDASFVRHQGQNQEDVRYAHDRTEAVRQELDHHLGDHWRGRP